MLQSLISIKLFCLALNPLRKNLRPLLGFAGRLAMEPVKPRAGLYSLPQTTFVLSLENLKKIDPEVVHLTDEELKALRQFLYEHGQLIFEDWWEKKFGSKNPIGSLHDND